MSAQLVVPKGMEEICMERLNDVRQDLASRSLEEHRDAHYDENEGPPVTQQRTELWNQSKIRHEEEHAYDDEDDGDGPRSA
jgi:hypothetical protein